MSPESDFDAWLTAAREGSAWALAELYRSIYPRIVAYLRGVEPAHGDDVASETWLDIARGLVRFEGDERAFRAWALTIARRRVADLRRRRTRTRTDPAAPHDIAEAVAVGNVEDEAFASLGTDWAFDLITSSLPPNLAEVILLNVVGDLGTAEVARILGRRPGTIRVMQHRALRRLARTLEAQGVSR